MISPDNVRSLVIYSCGTFPSNFCAHNCKVTLIDNRSSLTAMLYLSVFSLIAEIDASKVTYDDCLGHFSTLDTSARRRPAAAMILSNLYYTKK